MSCTSSVAHTGLEEAGQDGQIHSDSSSTTLQPMLWGALQGNISQASVKNVITALNMYLNGNSANPNEEVSVRNMKPFYQKFR